MASRRKSTELAVRKTDSRTGLASFPWMLCLFLLLVSRPGRGQEQSPCPKVSDLKTAPETAFIGATINRAEPAIGDGVLYPEPIVLIKDGKVVRTIDNEFFNWDWIFWNDGRQVASDQSPLHFMQVYALFDIATGKKLATFTIPQDAGQPPDWVLALQKHDSARPSPQPAAVVDCRFRLPAK